MDQGSTRKRSAVHHLTPTVTKFCVMWEGQALPHDTKFGNSRYEIVGTIVIFIWSLIHGLYWSGLIKAEPGLTEIKAWISNYIHQFMWDMITHPRPNFSYWKWIHVLYYVWRMCIGGYLVSGGCLGYSLTVNIWKYDVILADSVFPSGSLPNWLLISAWTGGLYVPADTTTKYIWYL